MHSSSVDISVSNHAIVELALHCLRGIQNITKLSLASKLYIWHKQWGLRNAIYYPVIKSVDIHYTEGIINQSYFGLNSFGMIG